jgi:hypothetical protein
MKDISLSSRYIPPVFGLPYVAAGWDQMKRQRSPIGKSHSPTQLASSPRPLRVVSHTEELSLFALKAAWFDSEMIQVNGVRRRTLPRNSRRADGGREGLVDAITLSNRGIDMDFSPRRPPSGLPTLQLLTIEEETGDILCPLYCEPIPPVVAGEQKPTDLRCYALRVSRKEFGGWRRAPQLEMLGSGEAEVARQELTQRQLRAHFPHSLKPLELDENLNGYRFPGVFFAAPSFIMYDAFWNSIPATSSSDGWHARDEVLYPKVIKFGPTDYWGAMYAAMRFSDNHKSSFVLFYEYKIGAWQNFRSDSVALAVQMVPERQELSDWWDKNLHGNWSHLPDGGKISGLTKLFEEKSDRISWTLGDGMVGLAVAKKTLYRGEPFFKITVTTIEQGHQMGAQHWN